MGQESLADPLTALVGAHIGVPDQRHTIDVLDAHDANQATGLLVSPELHPLANLVAQRRRGHVGLVPLRRGGSHPGTLTRRR